MKQGFTLIEIMIAVAIIAILAAIAIPSFAKYRGEAQEAVCKSQKNSIQIAAEHWLSKPENSSNVKNNTAPTWNDLVSSDGKGYFKEKPKCPCCDEDYDITIDNDTKAVKVTCPEHDDSGEGGNEGEASNINQ